MSGAEQEPKTDAEYLFQEPCSEGLIKLRAEVLGEILLRKKLNMEIVEPEEDN